MDCDEKVLQHMCVGLLPALSSVRSSAFRRVKQSFLPSSFRGYGMWSRLRRKVFRTRLKAELRTKPTPNAGLDRADAQSFNDAPCMALRAQVVGWGLPHREAGPKESGGASPTLHIAELARQDSYRVIYIDDPGFATYDAAGCRLSCLCP